MVESDPVYRQAVKLLRDRNLPDVCADVANLHVYAVTPEALAPTGLREAMAAARSYWRVFDREVRFVPPGSVDTAAVTSVTLPSPPVGFSAKEVRP